MMTHPRAEKEGASSKSAADAHAEGMELQQWIELVRHKKFTKGKITLGKAGKGGSY